MSRWQSDEDQPLEEWECPDPDEDADDELSATVECPNCAAEVYEDAAACPVCGEYVTRNRTIWDGRPAWWIILGIAGMIALMLFLLPF
ncbi:MAG: hypothetical protein DWQ34_19670 [Planctomycetota bacterium]|nr:MAG: hypothetical protein DWQ34_19670 [Planctomycetota bacterium]REK28953.1 MAG: hypothetical protein DWQ41_05250 [Planctomycetota bacterium]REK39613.1 MAG: hypothetical protein DWQ45_01695 [Planctomycetota bacterium]